MIILFPFLGLLYTVFTKLLVYEKTFNIYLEGTCIINSRLGQ